MKNVYIFQVVSEIRSFVWPKDSKRQTDQRPDMNGAEAGAMVMAKVVNLSMTVVAAGNAIIRAGFHNLVVFDLAVCPAFFSETRLQEATAAAAAVIVGLVRRHLDDVFFANHRFNDVAQVVSDDVTFAFTDNLAGVLNSELDFSILVPGGTDFEASLPDPLGIISIDGSYFEFMVDIKFFKSGPD